MSDYKEDLKIVLAFLFIIIAIIVYNKEYLFSNEEINKVEILEKLDTSKLNLFQEKTDANSSK